MRYLLTNGASSSPDSRLSHHAIGMQQLEKALGCSVSLLYGIRHEVDFSPAVISHIGRKEVFDIEGVRALADEYMSRTRKERRGEA